MSAALREWAMEAYSCEDDDTYQQSVWEQELEEEWEEIRNVAMSEWYSIIDFLQHEGEILTS